MKKTNRTQRRLAEKLDKLMLDVLENGQVVLDQQSGNPVTITPSAAMLNVIAKRVKEIGASSAALPGSVQHDLLERARQRDVGLKFKGRKLPEVDATSKDAATG